MHISYFPIPVNVLWKIDDSIVLCKWPKDGTLRKFIIPTGVFNHGSRGGRAAPDPVQTKPSIRIWIYLIAIQMFEIQIWITTFDDPLNLYFRHPYTRRQPDSTPPTTTLGNWSFKFRLCEFNFRSIKFAFTFKLNAFHWTFPPVTSFRNLWVFRCLVASPLPLGE